MIWIILGVIFYVIPSVFLIWLPFQYSNVERPDVEYVLLSLCPVGNFPMAVIGLGVYTQDTLDKHNEPKYMNK